MAGRHFRYTAPSPGGLTITQKVGQNIIISVGGETIELVIVGCNSSKIRVNYKAAQHVSIKRVPKEEGAFDEDESN